MTKHQPKPAAKRKPLPWQKRTAADRDARRQRCPDCHGVLPEYLCRCGGIGCMECGYRNVKPCKCGVQ